MAQATQFDFTWQEVAKMMIRDQGITDGHWIAAFRVNWIAGDTTIGGQNPLPGVSIQLPALTLIRVDAPTPHSVDASQINAWPAEMDAKLIQ